MADFISNSTLVDRAGISLTLRSLSRFFSKGAGGKAMTLQLMAVSSSPCAVLVSDGHNRAWVKLTMLPRDVVSCQSSEDSFPIVTLTDLRKDDGSTRSSSGAPIYLSATSISLECAVDDDGSAIGPVTELDDDEEPPLLNPYGDASSAPALPLSALASVMASEGMTSRSPSSVPTPSAPAPDNSTGPLSAAKLFQMIPRDSSAPFVNRKQLRLSDITTATTNWYAFVRMVSLALRPAGTRRPHSVHLVDKTGELFLSFWTKDDTFELEEMVPGRIYAILGNGTLEENKYKNNRLEMKVSLASENRVRRQVGRDQLTVAEIDPKLHPRVLDFVPDASDVSSADAPANPVSTARTMGCGEAIQAAIDAPAGSPTIFFDLPRAYIVSVSGVIPPRAGSNMSARRVVEVWDSAAPSTQTLSLTVWGDKGAAESLYELAPTAFSSLVNEPIPVLVTGLAIDPTKEKVEWRFKVLTTARFTRRVDDGSGDQMSSSSSSTESRIKELVPNLIKLAAVDATAHDEVYSLLAYVPALSEVRMIGAHQKVEINLYDPTATRKMSLFPTDPLVGEIRRLPDSNVVSSALTSLPDSVDKDVAAGMQHQLALDPDDPSNKMYFPVHTQTPLVLFHNVRTFISQREGGNSSTRYISTSAGSKLVVLDRKSRDPLIVEAEEWYRQYHNHFQASLQPSVPRDRAAYTPAVAMPTVKPAESLFSAFASRAPLSSSSSSSSSSSASYADDDDDSRVGVTQAEMERASRMFRKRPLVLDDDE